MLCNNKTGILPSPVCEMVEVEDLNLNDERLVDNLSDESREIIEHCIYQLDTHSPTEEPLTFEEIVDLVNAEDTENTENTIDDSDEETSPVQLKEARIGLETAFKFFEQQPNNVGIDVNDLRVFREVYEFT